MSQAMRRVAILLFVLLPSLLFADVLKITVDDAIHPITEEFIGRAVQQAQSSHADALLIELQTPGGLETSMRKIVEQITVSRVPVIIYVTPSGARAASAGFVILEAADVAAMAPGTNTGAAHPVAGGGGQIDDVMKQKITNDAAALVRSIAEKRGRNVPVAESAVRESKSFTEKEALQQKLIDIISPNEQDLLKQLNGREITRWDGSKTKLKTDGPVREYTMTLKQEILAWLMNPNMAFVILAIGLLSLYVEFNHPGAIVPGVVGFFFIVLAVFALNILPIRYSAFAMIVLAFVFFALEAKFTSHGALTIAGIASLTIGALLLVDGPIPEMRVHLWTALAVSIPLGAITAFLMSIALKARRNKLASGAEAMLGQIAIAETALAPSGKVFVHGETWNARSTSPVAPGQKVRVTRVDGLWLEVEPVSVGSPATLTDATTRA